MKYIWFLKKDSNEFCGEVVLQHSSEYRNELGITLLKAHQNKGIGTGSIVGFCNWLNKEKALNEIIVRIDPENKRSQHVFEKLGAEFICQKSGLSKAMENFLRHSDENIDLDAIGPYFYKLDIPIEKN